MQNAAIISVNLWQTIVSLLNLVILFWILKKLLFDRVRKMLKERQDQVDVKLNEADENLAKAKADQAEWSKKLESADTEAAGIIRSANLSAKAREDKIVSDANERASEIIRQAEMEAELERKKVEADVRQEIADVSSAIAGKVLGREVSAEEHRDLIDDMIEGLGDSHDSGK